MACRIVHPAQWHGVVVPSREVCKYWHEVVGPSFSKAPQKMIQDMIRAALTGNTDDVPDLSPRQLLMA